MSSSPGILSSFILVCLENLNSPEMLRGWSYRVVRSMIIWEAGSLPHQADQSFYV